jgi:hypothetical protein
LDFQGFTGISWRLGWARPLCWRIPERRLNLCPRVGVEGRNAIILALLPLLLMPLLLRAHVN